MSIGKIIYGIDNRNFNQNKIYNNKLIYKIIYLII